MLNRPSYPEHKCFKNTTCLLLPFAYLILTISTVFAQSPNWYWAKTAGGNNLETSVCVATDESGNVYVTGYFDSPSITFGTITLLNSSIVGYDLFIAKYDSNGNVIWATSPTGGIWSEGAFGVAIDGNSNVYVTGYFDSPSITFGSITLSNTGASDVFLAKYNSAGNVLWAVSAEGSSYDVAYSVAADSKGNAYVTGSFQGPSISFGGTLLNNSGGNDMFLVTYDSSGNVLWASSSEGTEVEEGVSVKADKNGDVYVTGSYHSSSIAFGSIQLYNAGGWDLFFVKYDSLGNVLWAKSAGGTDDDYGKSLASDESGNIYMTGAFTSPFIIFDTYVLNIPGLYIVKYSPAGNALWATTSVSGGGNGFGIDTDENGMVYVTGNFYTSSLTLGATVLNSAGVHDLFIAKYDSSGNVQWAKSAGGNGNEYSYGVAASGTDGIYVTGYFYSDSISFGSTIFYNAGEGDMFLARLGTMSLTGFSASDTNVCEKFCIDYYDQSINNPVTWLWSFEGGDPPASSDQNPLGICYEYPGTFDVSLISTYSSGYTDTLVLTDFISVYANPFAPIITQNGNVLTCSNGASYQWYLNTVLIPGATNQSYTITQSGLYTVAIEDENGCQAQTDFDATWTSIENLSVSFQINIIPNPASDQITVSVSSSMFHVSSLRIINLLGQQVLSSEVELDGETFSISIESLPRGIYKVIVFGEEGMQQMSFVKQ